MAYSEKQWLDAEGYFKAGLSLSQIQERTSISRSAISKRAKTEQWEKSSNADYIEAKEIIAVKKSTENQHLLNIADEVADEKIRRMNLVYGIQEKALRKADIMLDQIDSAQDLKTIIDGVDRAAITLKVADRHAKSGDVNVSTTAVAQSNSTATMTKEEMIEEAKRRGIPLEFISA